MKLKIQDWKSAWFDAHINDRFFQEMSRVEKGMVNDLNTSAHWMEQVMIDVGHLAQAMIRLEKADTPEPHIRQAMEKSLRLAALSLQLVTTLDGLDREMLKSGQRQYASLPMDQHPPREQIPSYAREPLPPAAQMPPQMPPPQISPQPVAPPREDSPSPQGAMPPFLMRQLSPHPQGQANGAKDGAAPAGEEAFPMATKESTGEDTREATAGFNAGTDPEAEMEFNAPGSGTFQTLSPFLDFSPDRPEVATSRMHDTIVSLSQQGLSRAEIEAVTGEPRHIIEALINHARNS